MTNNFIYLTKTFIPYEYDVKDADVIFMGIPFSSTSVSSPSTYGPTIFRESMKLIEGYEDGKNIFDLKMCDLGNIDIVPGSYSLTRERIIETIKEVRKLNEKALLVFIGGEHLITLPIIEAIKPSSVIHLDAHDDMRDDYMGNKFSHTTWARRAAENGFKIMQYGVRSTENGIKPKNDFDNFLNEVSKMDKYHVSLDIDVLDLQYVETGLPEPDGISPAQLFEIMKHVGKKAMSLDIVEMSGRCLPSKTGIMAANAVKKFLSVRQC